MSNFLQDAFVLAAQCVRQMLAGSERGWLVLTGAALAGVSCYFLCHKSTKLWNRRFQVRFAHHFYCAAAAIVGLLAVLLYVSCPFLKPVALASILVWQEQIQTDNHWSKATFGRAYDEVKKLGKEPPEAFEQSRKEDGLVPMSKPESQYKVASVYCNSASRHYAEERPFLSKLIRPDPEIPEESVVQDVKEYFASPAALDAVSGRHNPYPLRRTIELVARLMRQDLEEQVPRIVSRARMLVATCFLIGQAIILGSIGFAAYRDLKIKI